MKLHRSKLLIGLAAGVAALAVSAVSFAADAVSGTASITTLPGASTTGGAVAKTEWMGETITRPQGGSAKLIAGVDLFKVTLIDSSFSNQIRINVVWTDPHNAGKVLNNPNSYVRVQAYYPDNSCASSEQRTVSDGGDVTVCPVTAKEDFDVLYFTEANVSGMLIPTQAGQSTLYILGDIVVPGGVAPGQQAQLSELDFWAQARRR